MTMNNMQAKRAKVKGYGLVIDKDGMPRILNPLTVPDDVWNGLTEVQKKFANNRVGVELQRA